MLPNVRKFYRPTSLEEAVALLNSEKERNVVLGGGTQLALSAHPGIEGLIDLGGLGLDKIERRGEEIVIGARARPSDLFRSELLRDVADNILAEAAGNYLAEVQRNRASIGGILISCAAWADIAAALLAIGGRITIAGKDGEKTMTVDEFYEAGPSKAAHRAIITELRIRAGGRGAYQRLAKTETDISILSSLVRLDEETDGTIREARVVIGGATALPVRVREVEEKLRGKRLDPALAEEASRDCPIETVGDFRASADYRRKMAAVLTKRALAALAK